MAKPTKKKQTTEDGLGIKRERQIKNKELVAVRRAQIMEAALKLFLKKGPHSATIADIAKESGVNPASIYDYVENKNHILTLLFDDMLGMSAMAREKLLPDIDVNTPDDLEAYVRQFISNVWNFRPETILLAYRATYLLEEDVKKRVMLKDLEHVKEEGETIRNTYGLDPNDDRAFVAAAIKMFLHAFLPLRGWMLRDYDQERILEITTEVLMNGINGLMKKEPGHASPG